MMPPLLAVTPDPLDLMGLVERVLAERAAHAEATGDENAGAVTSFLGTVRDKNQGRRVTALDYEAYEPLAVRVFERIAEEIAREWPDTVLALHHRTGTLKIGEVSVAIAVASPHRAAAFAACRYAIERVKQIAPIWKRELFEGGDTWIEGAVTDPDDETARTAARVASGGLACA
jgi:molybdopterin synthase catalytic subunit